MSKEKGEKGNKKGERGKRQKLSPFEEIYSSKRNIIQDLDSLYCLIWIFFVFPVNSVLVEREI